MNGPAPWALALDGSGDASSHSVAAAAGRIFVTGSFTASLPIAGQTVYSSGASDGFIAAFDSSGGGLWAQSWGGMGPDAMTALATHRPSTGQTTLAVALSYVPPIDLPGQIQPERLAGRQLSGDARPGAILVAFDGDGRATRVEPFRASRRARINALDYASDGSLAVAGAFTGTIRIGDRVLTSAGATDIFVARFTAQGDLAWAARAGGPRADMANDIAASGDLLVVVGSFSSQADFGQQSVTASRPAHRYRPSQDGFVAAFGAEQGRVRWITPFGGGSSAAAMAVDILATSRQGVPGEVQILCAGHFDHRVRMGANVLTAVGSSDGFAAGLDADGQPRWAVHIGGPGSEHATALAAMAGRIAIAGMFEDKVSIQTVGQAAGDSLESRGKHDVFAIEIDSAGQVISARSLGGPGHDAVRGIAVQPRDRLYMVGSFEGTARIGGQLDAASGRSAFVSALTW
ncbi:MAG: hypothetical protein MJE77_47315 [Proteobacteria bacterium]|nr:hypothetical protein [Pseudomonadota bacterium]